MALPSIGTGVAIFKATEAAAKSVHDVFRRVRNLAAQSDTFEFLDNQLWSTCGLANEIIRLMTHMDKGNIPEPARRNFTLYTSIIFQRVERISKFIEDFEKLFGVDENGSLSPDHLSRKWRRLMCTDENAKKLHDTETSMKEVQGELFKLTELFGLKLHKFFRESGSKRSLNIPCVPSTTVLDFSSASGTPESEIYERVFDFINSDNPPNIPLIVVKGTGGSGKSLAALAVASDRKVRAAFYGGVYYIHFSDSTDDAAVIEKLGDLISSRSPVERDEEYSTLKKTIEMVSSWFMHKPCLFLFDNVCYSPGRPDGYLSDLTPLLKKFESMIIATTREVDASADAYGGVINCSAREKDGVCARNMLINHANARCTALNDALSFENYESQLKKLLKSCNGLPLNIAVVGSSIGSLRNLEDTWGSTLEIYIDDFDNGHTEDVRRCDQSLRRSVLSGMCTVERLARRKMDWKAESLTCMDLFLRLCIFKSGDVFTNSELSVIWPELQNRDVGMFRSILLQVSLLVLDKDAGAVTKVRTHDHIHQFCEEEARRRNYFDLYHSNVLNDRFRESDMGDDACRPWWRLDAKKERFLIKNISRFLCCSGKLQELTALLTDVRWTLLRLKVGGVAQLEEDFDSLIRMLKKSGVHGDAATLKAKSLVYLRDSISNMSHYVNENIEDLAPQAFGRLLDYEDPHDYLRTYMESTAVLMLQPWLKPVTRCWAEPQTQHFTRIDTRINAWHAGVDWKRRVVFVEGHGECLEYDLQARRAVYRQILDGNCLAMSLDGRFLAVRKNDGLQVWDSYQKRIVPWASNTQYALRVTVASWSCDGSVLVVGGKTGPISSGWLASMEGPNSDSPGRYLMLKSGVHKGGTTAVAVTKGGNLIVSASKRGNLKVWKTASEKMLWESPNNLPDQITVLAVSAEGNFLAAATSRKLNVWVESDNKSKYYLGYQHEYSQIEAASFNEDGTFLLFSDSWDVRMIDTQSWTEVFRSHTNMPSTRAVLLDPKADYAVFAGNGSQFIVQRTTKIRGGNYTSNSYRLGSSVTSLQSSDDRSITLAAIGNSVFEVDTGSGKVENTQNFACKHNIRFSFANTTSFLVCQKKFGFIWFSRQSNEQLRIESKAHNEIIADADLSENGQHVATVDANGVVKVWPTEGRPQRYTGKGPGRKAIEIFGEVVKVALSEDGKRVVSTFSKTMFFWEHGKRKAVLKEWCLETVTDVKMSNDGKFVVTGGTEGSVTVREWAQSDPFWTSDRTHSCSVTSPRTVVSLSRGGRLIVSSGMDRRMQLWENSGSMYERVASVTIPSFGTCVSYTEQPARNPCDSKKYAVVGCDTGEVHVFVLVEPVSEQPGSSVSH